MAKRKKQTRRAPATTAPAAPPPPARNTLLAFALRVAATMLVSSSVASHPFVTLDDEDYVVHNPMVLKGLTGEGLDWAFTTFHAANWHPLTWLSHMTDVSMF